MKKIHMELVNEKVIKKGETILVPKHYFYLCCGNARIFLCKQRPYHGVSLYFRKDLPVNALHTHKWGRDKMVDHIIDLLPSRIASAERWELSSAF